jgi:hypothetical protein
MDKGKEPVVKPLSSLARHRNRTLEPPSGRKRKSMGTAPRSVNSAPGAGGVPRFAAATTRADEAAQPSGFFLKNQ